MQLLADLVLLLCAVAMLHQRQRIVIVERAAPKQRQGGARTFDCPEPKRLWDCWRDLFDELSE